MLENLSQRLAKVAKSLRGEARLVETGRPGELAAAGGAFTRLFGDGARTVSGGADVPA